eukprot:TRINITY_DN18512_c0_g1_i1.p1 TRINITY_DN18512_c0_g1~~TRINITY_DN18512_c0_g1_i1.p1  ORF type:complete len:742 (+),score=97.34 TRINITY_DN18512_c0_g1_i1:101-2326(+)
MVPPLWMWVVAAAAACAAGERRVGTALGVSDVRTVLWPRGEVAYAVSPAVSDAVSATIASAVRGWADATCLRFTECDADAPPNAASPPCPDQEQLVRFVVSEGAKCTAPLVRRLGTERRGPGAVVSLPPQGCAAGIVGRAVGHAVGLEDESGCGVKQRRGAPAPGARRCIGPFDEDSIMRPPAANAPPPRTTPSAGDAAAVAFLYLYPCGGAPAAPGPMCVANGRRREATVISLEDASAGPLLGSVWVFEFNARYVMGMQAVLEATLPGVAEQNLRVVSTPPDAAFGESVFHVRALVTYTPGPAPRPGDYSVGVAFTASDGTSCRSALPVRLAPPSPSPPTTPTTPTPAAPTIPGAIDASPSAYPAPTSAPGSVTPAPSVASAAAAAPVDGAAPMWTLLAVSGSVATCCLGVLGVACLADRWTRRMRWSEVEDSEEAPQAQLSAAPRRDLSLLQAASTMEPEPDSRTRTSQSCTPLHAGDVTMTSPPSSPSFIRRPGTGTSPSQPPSSLTPRALPSNGGGATRTTSRSELGTPRVEPRASSLLALARPVPATRQPREGKLRTASMGHLCRREVEPPRVASSPIGALAEHALAAMLMQNTRPLPRGGAPPPVLPHAVDHDSASALLRRVESEILSDPSDGDCAGDGGPTQQAAVGTDDLEASPMPSPLRRREERPPPSPVRVTHEDLVAELTVSARFDTPSTAAASRPAPTPRGRAPLRNPLDAYLCRLVPAQPLLPTPGDL